MAEDRVATGHLQSLHPTDLRLHLSEVTVFALVVRSVSCLTETEPPSASLLNGKYQSQLCSVLLPELGLSKAAVCLP